MDSRNILLILNSLSAVSALCVVVLFGLLVKRGSPVVDRVSVRLQAGISLIDLMRHVQVFFSASGDDSLLCKFLGFFDVSLEHAYWYLNICIALNMQLVLIHGLCPNKKWEMCYWTFSFLGILTFVFPLSALDIFGKSNSGSCYIKNGIELNDTIEMLYYNIPSTITIIYCFIISLADIFKVNRIVALSELPKSQEICLYTSENKAVIRRVAMYPIACFLANVGMNVHILYDFLNEQPNPILYAWAKAGFYSTGLLNLLAIMADPLIFEEMCGFYTGSFINMADEFAFPTAASSMASLQTGEALDVLCISDQEKGTSISFL
ncbi:hypothetical protein DSO57_1014398 [Entomophthora muscae]|uniref:Uncharacterized protein n=1 Tax=Entomophthora muscae TaxID=34485 RepID=A0ACC2UFT6_9FUNG|nr:hypothetical protein DSO57_1014398 [Entomophthora muscae]